MEDFEQTYKEALQRAVLRFNNPNTSDEVKKALAFVFVKERLKRTRNEIMIEALIKFLEGEKDVTIYNWQEEQEHKQKIDNFIIFLYDLLKNKDDMSEEQSLTSINDDGATLQCTPYSPNTCTSVSVDDPNVKVFLTENELL